jgi:hypothetical protein
MANPIIAAVFLSETADSSPTASPGTFREFLHIQNEFPLIEPVLLFWRSRVLVFAKYQWLWDSAAAFLLKSFALNALIHQIQNVLDSGSRFGMMKD